MNRYLSTIILLSVLGNLQLPAQSLQPAPRLVVNIAVDQLRTDYIEHFSPLYGENGFRKLLLQGTVYEAASYPLPQAPPLTIIILWPPNGSTATPCALC